MPQTTLIRILLVAMAFAWLPAGSLQAGGPRTLKLGSIELHRNGSGFRKKGPLTLYEGTLYLSKSSDDATTIIAADQPMAIRIEVTSGFVSRTALLEALDSGFENATGGQTEAIASAIRQFRQCFAEPIAKNDVFVLSYLPGAGVIVHKNGRQKGVVAGLPFKQALFAIWLSDRPADQRLRTAMLGK
jgi:hypothetical protein